MSNNTTKCSIIELNIQSPYQWTLGQLPPSGNCEKRCYSHRFTHISSESQIILVLDIYPEIEMLNYMLILNFLLMFFVL